MMNCCKYKFNKCKDGTELHVAPQHKHMLTYMENVLAGWKEFYDELPDDYRSEYAMTSWMNGTVLRSHVTHDLESEIKCFRRWLAERADVKAKQ